MITLSAIRPAVAHQQPMRFSGQRPEKPAPAIMTLDSDRHTEQQHTKAEMSALVPVRPEGGRIFKVFNSEAILVDNPGQMATLMNVLFPGTPAPQNIDFDNNVVLLMAQTNGAFEVEQVTYDPNRDVLEVTHQNFAQDDSRRGSPPQHFTWQYFVLKTSDVPDHSKFVLDAQSDIRFTDAKD